MSPFSTKPLSAVILIYSSGVNSDHKSCCNEELTIHKPDRSQKQEHKAEKDGIEKALKTSKIHVKSIFWDTNIYYDIFS